MNEATTQLFLPLQEVKPVHGNKGQRYRSKYPDSPRLCDFPDRQSYTRAYQAYFREKRPNYHDEWTRKPENIERYRPALVPSDKPPPHCHHCGTEKVRSPKNQWICQPCTDAKNARKQRWLEQMATLPERREAKRLAIIEQKRRAAINQERRNQREAERLKKLELRKLKESRPAALIEGFFLTEDELAGFNDRITLNGDCAVWTGKPKEVHIAGIETSPHRLAWFLKYGPVTEGKILAKTCETRNCINPAHRREEDPPEPKVKTPYIPDFRPIPTLSTDHIARFNSKINKDGACWVWTGQSDTEGYGRFSIYGVHYAAHRVAYFLANGSIDDSLQVHHGCDSPWCVSPGCLSQGDHTKNHEDGLARGRIINDQLTTRQIEPDEDDIAEIKRVASLGVRLSAIGRKFGVSEERILQITSPIQQ